MKSKSLPVLLAALIVIPVTAGLLMGATRGGTGTRLLSTAPAGTKLVAQSSSVVSPGSNTITLLLPADTTAAPGTTVTYTVALSSSDSACTTPASVDLTWYAATGGSSIFVVDCAAVRSDRNVTITGGTATASFDLLAAPKAN